MPMWSGNLIANSVSFQLLSQEQQRLKKNKTLLNTVAILVDWGFCKTGIRVAHFVPCSVDNEMFVQFFSNLLKIKISSCLGWFLQQ